jgi:short-chain 2-methylacyl-CoA dehydrogenase
MDLRLTEEQESLRKTVAEFCADEVAPVIGEYYAQGKFPLPLVESMAKMGLFGLPFPEEYGGMGGDYVTLCVAIEEIARVDSSLAITLEAAVSLGAMPIYRFGSEELKQQWLPKLASGEMLGAFGLTEPGAGSDAGGTATTAVRDGDEWVINGSKAFITNSGTAITGLITVTAVTDRSESGAPQISSILVPAGTPGLTVESAYRKVGWDASDTHGLSFDNVRVPLGNLVGPEGRGYAQFLQILDEGRVAIAALAAGLAQGCVDESVPYANTREAFGRSIGSNQGLAFLIADMEIRAHTARVVWREAAGRMQRGEPFKHQAAIAKVVTSEAAMDNARAATQVFGGYGFTIEYPVGRFYRDAKILEVGEGTTQVQQMLIARELGLPS